MDLVRLLLAPVLIGCALPPAAPAQGTSAPLRVREALASGDGPVRIVCFGDSVTGLYYHSGGVRAYPELIDEALAHRHPEAEVSVVNAGISGHTTSNGLARLQRDVLVHRPHLVTVMFGLNDVAKGSLPLYRRNLAEIVGRCRAAGADVLLCTPNAVMETPQRPAEKVAAFAEATRGVARELSVPLCDPHADLETLRARDPETWRLSMSDEIHPNLRGHRRLAESILRSIAGAEIALPDDAPVSAPLASVAARLRQGLPVRLLAMPPFDALAADALREAAPGVAVAASAWPVAGLDRPALVKDASHRVRPLSPDLVVIAVPRAAAARDREEFIRTQMWIANHSLSRGKREWDLVVVHPDVSEGRGGETERDRDAIVREVAPAQDLPLVDRQAGDERPADAILREWLKAALARSGTDQG